jgi:hypothetical protein
LPQLEVREYQIDRTDPAATQDQYKVVDTNGKTCALIKVQIPLDSVSFDNNVIRVARRDGAYWVYVMQGTEFFDIIPSSSDIDRYKINPLTVDLKSAEGGGVEMATYRLEIILKTQTPRSSFLLSAGFNAVGIMGPTVSAGFMFHNFTIEAGAVYGLAKSSDVYIYDKASVLKDAYQYSSLRGFLRAGYDIWAAPVFAVTPQVGAAFTSMSGKRLSDVTLPAEKTLDGATAISLTLGARLQFAPSGASKPLRIFLLPEYDVALQKSKNYKALAAFDNKIKSWAEGLQLSLGLMFYF